MKILNISIENFLSFKEKIELNDIKPLTIFVGPNNAGKSNILKALEIINKIARNDFPNNWDGLIFDKKDNKATLEIALELSNEERQEIIHSMHGIDHMFNHKDLSTDPLFRCVVYRLEFGSRGITSEQLYILNSLGEMIMILQLEGGSGNYITSKIGLISYIKNSGNTKFKSGTLIQYASGGIQPGFFQNLDSTYEDGFIANMIRKFFQHIRFVSTIRKPAEYLPSQEQTQVDQAGSNVAQVMNTLLNNSPEDFVRQTNRSKKLIPGITKISAPLIGSNVTIRINEEGRTTPTDIKEMSEGLKQTLVLSTLVHSFEPSTVVCIEEPELNIHPSSQKELFSLFRENPNRNQFFITTHSPIFTGIGEDIDTFLITKPKGISHLYPIKEKEDLKFVKQELGIKNSDMFGYDGVIFVEGDSEEEALRILGPAMGFTILGHTIRIINLTGSGMVTRLNLLLEYLKQCDTKAFLIVDKHKETVKKIPEIVSEGLIEKDNCTIWDKNFEDTFTSEQIITSMNNICKRSSWTFNLDVTTLNSERRSRNVFDVIAENFYKQNKKQLNKKDLARELSYVIVNDILNNTGHVEGPLEKAIRVVMNRITN